LGPELTAELLLDNSAWARLDQDALAQDRAEEIAGWLEEGRIATCLPFLLEAGYSARNARDHDALLADLMSLPNISIDERVEARAIEAQRQLARAGHHRLPPVDLIIAALADNHGLGVLHYDHDYEIVREKTDLRFDSVWLAPRGSI
jgi:predicted nucleic acid-binding protein